MKTTIMLLVVLFSTAAFAQDEKKFAAKGTWEFGGTMGFERRTSVQDGTTSEPLSVLHVSPFIGYFIADGFELGFNPLGIAHSSSGGSSLTQLMMFVAPSYNFVQEGPAYPFVEALLGYTALTGSEYFPDRSGFSWGGRAGLKAAVGENGLLNVGLQYLAITMKESGASERRGEDIFSITVGFTVWH